MVEFAQQEDGSIYFRASRDSQDPSIVRVIQHWASREAFLQHHKAEIVKTARALSVNALEHTATFSNLI